MRPPVPLLLLAAATCPALEQPPLPADLRWQIALDVHALMAGRLGQWVERIAGRDPVQARLTAVAHLTGVDLLHDLQVVVVGGVDARLEEAMAVATGTFDAPTFEVFLRSLPEHESLHHRGHVEHAWTLESLKARPAAALALDGHAVVSGGSVARTEVALDVLDAVAPAADAAGFPSAEVPVGSAALLSILARDVGDWRGLPPEAGPGRAIRAVSAVVGEKDGVLLLSARLVAIDSASGARFASMIDGGVSALALDSRTRTDAALTALVDSVTISREGPRVDVTAMLPIDLAERTWDARLDAGLRPRR
jgi:hypothetical protein